MRVAWLSLIALGCSSASKKPVVPAPPTPRTEKAVAVEPPDALVVPKAVPLAADTPETTVAGNTFIAPAGWTVTVKSPATLLTPPEPGSTIAIVDVAAKDATEAIDLAWKAYKPDHKWPVLVSATAADHNGWSQQKNIGYQTSPNEKRDVGASAMYAHGMWTVAIFDLDQATEEKRGSQINIAVGRLYPKGYTSESFAGKKPHALDADRIAQLTKFLDSGTQQLGIPGAAFGIVENGKVVFAGGVGVKDLGKPGKPTGNTEFMIASNTKALTTLLLAKEVDAKLLTWDTPVIQLLPSFGLGDPETTKQVLVKHLICACTGMPRQDLEWIFEYAHATPETALAQLAKMQPTSKFGELFQYSNSMAGAAGFVAGHVKYPKLELGAAYDKALQETVLDPLGMKATFFDTKRALRGDHAGSHSPDIDGKTTHALTAVNDSILPLRPAGAAWSTVNDMLKYVQMELADGTLPDGKAYVSKEALLARRAPQVAISKDATYGMGLVVDTKYGTPVVHHGGDLVGYHSDMIWLPEVGVGAVVLTNGDPGWLLRDQFRRKLLEVLFDGRPEADANIAAAAKQWYEELAAQRKQLTVPADPAAVAKLAAHYHNDALGDVAVTKGKTTVFDFGEFKTEVASKANPDGTTSFVTTAPGLGGFEFVLDPRGLVTRDGQHEYVFAPGK